MLHFFEEFQLTLYYVLSAKMFADSWNPSQWREGKCLFYVAKTQAVVDHVMSEVNINHDIDHHDDVIKLKHFPRYRPFVRGIHRSPVNFPHKGQWRGALIFYLNYAWINAWENNSEAGDLRRHRAHYYVIIMWPGSQKIFRSQRQKVKNFSYFIGVEQSGKYCFSWSVYA